MDNPSNDESALESVKDGLYLKHPSPVKGQCSCSASSKDAVNDLINVFEESLQVKDAKPETDCDLPFSSHGDSLLEEEIRAGAIDILLNDPATANFLKCMSKCATFPVTRCISPASTDERGKAYSSVIHEKPSYSRSTSLLTPRKLISALKGSREKGVSPRKLKVSWALDVYDPLPSSVSHLPKKSHQQYKNKRKHGKGKHKGKNSKANSGGTKDKKHRNKTGIRTEQLASPLPPSLHQPCLDSFVGLEKPTLSSNCKSAVGLLDFDTEVDSPNSNCGSRFMRKAWSTLHLHYAEAT